MSQLQQMTAEWDYEQEIAHELSERNRINQLDEQSEMDKANERLQETECGAPGASRHGAKKDRVQQLREMALL